MNTVYSYTQRVVLKYQFVNYVLSFKLFITEHQLTDKTIYNLAKSDNFHRNLNTNFLAR